MPRRTFSHGVQLMSQAFIPFLVGGLAMSVLGNAVYQVLMNRLSASYSSTSAALQIALVSLVVLLVMLTILKQFVNRLRITAPIPDKNSPYPRKGLIVLVSNEPTVRKAINWPIETLQYCWLICSGKTQGLAEEFEQELLETGKQAKVLRIDDVFEPIEFRDAVNKVYAGLPGDFSEANVILDFTGMTSIASVGAVLACLDEQRAIQYVPAAYNKELDALEPLDPIEITLHWNMRRSASQKPLAG